MSPPSDAERAGVAAGAVLERGDTFARRWAVASITLLVVAALFGWALVVAR